MSTFDTVQQYRETVIKYSGTQYHHKYIDCSGQLLENKRHIFSSPIINISGVGFQFL